MAGDLVVSTINGGGIGTKNVIINGNFGINQRAVSGTVVLAAGAYGHDRFKAGASGCTYTFATAANVTTLTITAGSLIQVIEGLNLQSGTYTMSWTGTAQGKINGGSYGASGITGTATGGTNMSVEFNTGTLSLVQVEKGSTATPFEFRQHGHELFLGQRYYQQINYQQFAYVASGKAFGTTSAMGFVVELPVVMRVSPTTNYSGVSSLRVLNATNSSAATVSALTMATCSPSSVAFFIDASLSAGILSAGQATTIDTSYGSTFSLIASAEL